MEAIYLSFSILDLCTQWLFRGVPVAYNTMYLAPTRLFDVVRRAWSGKRETSKVIDEIIDECLTPLMSPKSNGFFSKICIDITIHHDSHFLKAFIVNAGMIPSRKHFIFTDDNNPVPCIIYCNSLPPTGIHSPKKVAETLQFLLNAVDKRLHGGGGKNFTKTTMPVYHIDGK